MKINDDDDDDDDDDGDDKCTRFNFSLRVLNRFRFD